MACSPDIDAFLDMLVAERAAAVNTRDAYRRDLDDTARWLGLAGVPLEGAGTEDLRRYLDHLQKSGSAPRTVARRLAALRQFYRFLCSEGRRRDDPASALDSPARGRALPKLLDEGEVVALIEQARKVEGAVGIRLVTLLEVLYATGLRVSELVELLGLDLCMDCCREIVDGRTER